MPHKNYLISALLTTTTSTTTTTFTSTSTRTTTLYVPKVVIAVNMSATLEGEYTEESVKARCFTLLAVFSHAYRLETGSSSAQPVLARCTASQSSVQVEIKIVVPQDESDAGVVATSNSNVTDKVKQMLSSPESSQQVARIVQQTIVEHVALAYVLEASEDASSVGQIPNAGNVVPTATEILAALPVEQTVVDAIREALPSVPEINAGFSIAQVVSEGAPFNVSGTGSASGSLASAFAAVAGIESALGGIAISTPAVAVIILTTTTSTSTSTRTTTSSTVTVTATSTAYIPEVAVVVNISARVSVGATDAQVSTKYRCFTLLALYTHSYRRVADSPSAQPTLGACVVTAASDGSGDLVVSLQIETVVPQNQRHSAEAAAGNSSVTQGVQEMLSQSEQEVANIVRQAIVEHVAFAKVLAADGSDGATSAKILEALPVEEFVLRMIESALPSVAEINRGNSVSEVIMAGAPRNASSSAVAAAPLADAFAVVPALQSAMESVSMSAPIVATYRFL